MEYKINFPKTLEEFKDFAKERLLNYEQIDDQICGAIVEKMNKGDFSFSSEEKELMLRITDMGPTCCCDSDHRIDPDAKVYIISET